jgi:hypothetical protein
MADDVVTAIPQVAAAYDEPYGRFGGLVLRLFLLRNRIELHHISVTADQIGIVPVELDDTVVHVVHLCHMATHQSLFDDGDRGILTFDHKKFLFVGRMFDLRRLRHNQSGK